MNWQVALCCLYGCRTEEPTMITDARVLQDEFLPPEIEHRNSETNELARALDPIESGESAETAFLFGPSGAGKTCIARFTVDRLRERVLDVRYEYINCWQNYSYFGVLEAILEGIGQTVDIHRQSTPRDELVKRIQEYDKRQYIVILDEVDQLEDKSVLYDLYTNRNISMILIANREEALFPQLDERLQSRLHSSRRIQFDRYDLSELVSILEGRVQWGLHEEAIEQEQLKLIADEAAGDARKAIGILRNSARTAQQEGLGEIATEIIRDSIPDATTELRQKNRGKLTPDQQLLLEIIEEHAGISPGELYDRYEKEVDTPKSDRTIRNYLSKMRHYNLVEAEGEKRARAYYALN